jgi:hypothetical protein
MSRTFSICVSIAAIVGLGAIAGCGDTKTKTKTTAKTSKDAKKPTDPHDHAHEGPHGGHVIELGDYHAELTHDDNTKSVAVYLLDGDLKNPVASGEPEITINLTVAGESQQYKLPAARQESDPEGKSSRFELKDEKLVDAWDAPNSKGRLTVSIDGKQYSGDIEAHDHEHKK